MGRLARRLRYGASSSEAYSDGSPVGYTLSPTVTRASTRWLAAHIDMAEATADWPAPPPKSPKATKPDATGSGTSVVEVVVATVDGAAAVLLLPPLPPPARSAPASAAITGRRRMNTPRPENRPKELSRSPLWGSTRIWGRSNGR